VIAVVLNIPFRSPQTYLTIISTMLQLMCDCSGALHPLPFSAEIRDDNINYIAAYVPVVVLNIHFWSPQTYVIIISTILQHMCDCSGTQHPLLVSAVLRDDNINNVAAYV
jgi:hypothetical protein